MFLLGRFAVVAVHETAHGLTMASFGRRVERAGLQAGADLPVRVRGHLGGVVRAAPAADRDQRRRAGVGLLARRGVLAVLRCCCPRAPCATSSSSSRSPRYVGAFFNLNPFIERDGYHMLVDCAARAGPAAAREGAVRAAAVAAAGPPTDSPVLAATRCAGSAGRCWRRCFAIGMSLRYEPICLDEFAPAGVVVWRRDGHALGGVLRPGARRARQAALAQRLREPEWLHTSEADVAAQLIERLLADPAFRARFRRDPAAACREAGLDELAEEMSLGAGKAMTRWTCASRGRAWRA